MYRFDYNDYAVQESDSLSGLLSRGGREPREITNFITHRIVEKRARTYYDLPSEENDYTYTTTSAGVRSSHPGDRLMANSGPAARDGDHITTEENTLIISHPGGDYERYQLSSQQDITMRRVQLGFYAGVITIALLLGLSWLWQKPSLREGKAAVLSATLNRTVPRVLRIANGAFRLLVPAAIILATLTAISAMLEWTLPGILRWTFPIYAIAIPVLVPLAITAILWMVTQLAHVLVCGRPARLPGAWGMFCFLGVYGVLFIWLLPWVV